MTWIPSHCTLVLVSHDDDDDDDDDDGDGDDDDGLEACYVSRS